MGVSYNDIESSHIELVGLVRSQSIDDETRRDVGANRVLGARRMIATYPKICV